MGQKGGLEGHHRPPLCERVGNLGVDPEEGRGGLGRPGRHPPTISPCPSGPVPRPRDQGSTVEDQDRLGLPSPPGAGGRRPGLRAVLGPCGGCGGGGRGWAGGDRLQRRERLLRTHPLRRVRSGVGPAGSRGGRPLSPCGRCRQLLLEHGGPDLLLDQGSDASPLALSLLLPGAFDSGELERRRAQ